VAALVQEVLSKLWGTLSAMLSNAYLRRTNSPSFEPTQPARFRSAHFG
jgi:hypothetical protein